jgi:DNA-binding CsgD family transcriptional regulator
VPGHSKASSLDSFLIALLVGGARAASYELGVEGGCLVDRVCTDDAVGAHLRGAYADGRPVDRVGHLGAAAIAYLGAISLQAIERPNTDLLFWQAACCVDIYGPSRVWTPRPVPATEPRARVAVVARDMRGLAGVLYTSDERALTLGRRVSHSSVPGGGTEARLRAAERKLGADGFRAAAAEGVTAQLASDEALAGGDAGVPSLSWAVSVREGDGRVLTIAASPTAGVERRPMHRLGRIRDAVLREAEAAAGTIDTASLSLNEALGDAELMLADTLSGRDDPTRRIELFDLLAELTPRERRVVELMVQGRSDAEIASTLRNTEATVRVLRHTARMKIVGRL